MKINVLAKDVADKIAAGEVIERPVSVVKELVENAIDAGSTDITVEITQGGKESIRVTDNGEGIEREEIEKAFLRHATSKIKTTDDLRKLNTLGFRGEALASISSVSRIEIISKTASEKIGTKLVLHSGEKILMESIGCPNGTTIIVRDLFFNLPARLKFMKSESAESGQIIDLLSRLAITRTDIKFRLISNGRTVFTTVGNGDLKNSIIAVYKDKDYKDLIPCMKEEEGIKVYGYISRPSFSRTNRRSQYFFVNGRTVKSNVIEKGVTLGYKERLFEGPFPIAFIFVEVDPSFVDVNIHPNKREVKFDDDVIVTSIVRDAIVEALTKKEAVVKSNDTYKKPDVYEKKYQIGESISVNKDRQDKLFEVPTGTQVGIREYLSSDKRKEEPKGKEADVSAIRYEHNFGTPDIRMPEVKPFDFDELSFGEAIFNTYITATDSENFYLFDQHAAHERINYEKFVFSYLNEEKNSQILLLPLTIDVPNEIVEDSLWKEILFNMGFRLELFGDNSFIFREIPEFMQLDEAESFIKTFIDEYILGNTISNTVVIDKLITKSCKSSVKAHDTLSKKEITALITNLKSCKNPFSCPHGRPTFIRFSLYDIERMFKRS